MSDHCATVATILTHASALVSTAENRELDTLETHQPLTDIIVCRWVDGAALGIPKKLVQSIVCCTLADLVVIVQLLALVHSIVNGTIGRILWWASIKACGGTTRMLLTITSVRAKRAIWILISTCCSRECLQVSDNYTQISLGKNE